MLTFPATLTCVILIAKITPVLRFFHILSYTWNNCSLHILYTDNRRLGMTKYFQIGVVRVT